MQKLQISIIYKKKEKIKKYRKKSASTRGLSLDNKRLDSHQDNIASARQWKKPLTFLAPLFLGEQVAVYIWLSR